MMISAAVRHMGALIAARFRPRAPRRVAGFAPAGKGGYTPAFYALFFCLSAGALHIFQHAGIAFGKRSACCASCGILAGEKTEGAHPINQAKVNGFSHFGAVPRSRYQRQAKRLPPPLHGEYAFPSANAVNVSRERCAIILQLVCE